VTPHYLQGVTDKKWRECRSARMRGQLKRRMRWKRGKGGEKDKRIANRKGARRKYNQRVEIGDDLVKLRQRVGRRLLV
jgi:hypothetical protein